MNYYTLKGSNANKFFQLSLNPDNYYEWDDVKKRAELQLSEVLDDKERDEIESNISSFQEIIDGRRRREKILRNLFEEKNINFLPHSYLVRNHIMYNRKCSNTIVRYMYMMKILFEKCDILNKWEDFKVKQKNQLYSFEEKDNFYEKTYKEFIQKNPKFRL